MAEIRSKWPWPQNIGPLGTYAEEVRAPKLEQNPDAAPMPAAAPASFLTPARSSEHLRVGEPPAFSPDPTEVEQLSLRHVVFRRVLARRKDASWRGFNQAVEHAPLEGLPEPRREQMRTMLRREQAMLQVLERYNHMAEQVYAVVVSEAKG